MRQNTADDNDARVDVGNDRRVDPYSSTTRLASFKGLSSTTSRQSISTRSVPSTDVIAVTRKKNQKKVKKNKLTGSSLQTLQLRSSLARPRMALRQTAHIAINSSAAKSQHSSISEVYFPTTLTTRNTAAKGSDHGMRRPMWITSCRV